MKKEEYLKKVMIMIDALYMHEDIRRELDNHIEDLTDEYVSQGISHEEAEQKAVEQMGSPKETGSLFNHVYRPKLEWKAAIYILVWSVAAGVVNFGRVFTDVPVWMTHGIGMVFIVFGFLWSAVEKYRNFDFFYAWANNWGRGTAIINACMFLGVGTGLAAHNIPEIVFTYIVITAVTIIQRTAISEAHSKKEKRFLWMQCTALEDFNYQGKASLDGKVLKVQIEKGEKAYKNEKLLITGTDGFRMTVEKL